MWIKNELLNQFLFRALMFFYQPVRLKHDVLIENGLIAGIGDNFRADITIMGKGFLLTPS